MTKLLEQVIEKVHKLPPDRQDEIAEVIAMIADGECTYTPEQIEKMERGYRQTEAGEFAPEEKITALLDKYRTI